MPAERPVFVVPQDRSQLVDERQVSFVWVPGLSPTQKRKNVQALHEAALRLGIKDVLEVSTKSDNPLGIRLSAFNLRVQLAGGVETALECAFQGSKVFSRGGPFTDLYTKSSREAKQDVRLRESGDLVRFLFEDVGFPLQPRTAFYDWLYARALVRQEEVLSQLMKYSAFSDIEFNPKKSFSCQARSCAIVVSLKARGDLGRAVESPEAWLETVYDLPNDQSKSNLQASEEHHFVQSHLELQ